MSQNERTADESKVAFKQVAHDERVLLNRKRKEVFGNHLEVEDLADAGQSIDKETDPPHLPEGTTVGLALSGGGIRSATFSLGVLQVLARMKFWNHAEENDDDSPNRGKGTSLLDRVDYLSTVSGGGYIGSWLAATYLRRKAAPRPMAAAGDACSPAPSPAFLGETSAELHHLRAFSSYLAPEAGAMKPDAWTMATIWARNTLLIQLPIWSCIVSLLLVKRLGAEAFVALAGLVDVSAGADWSSPWWWGAVVVGVAALLTGMWNAAREIGRYKTGNLGEARCQRGVVWWVVVPFMISAWCLGFALWVVYFIKDESPVGKELVWIPRGLLSDGERLTRMLMIAGAVGVVGALVPYFNFDRTRSLRRLWLTACAFVSAAGITMGVLKGLDVMLVKVGMPSAQTAMWSAKAEVKSAGSVEPGGAQVNLSLQAASAAKVAKPATKAAVPATGDWHGLYRNIIRCHLGLWLLAGLLFMATILIGLMGRDMADEVREWLSRLAAWMWIFLVVWLCLHLLALMAPRVAMGLFPFDDMLPWLESKGVKAGAVVAWLGTTVMSALAAKNPATGSSSTKPPPLMGLLARFGPYVALGGILVLGSLFTHLIVWQKDPLTSVFAWRTVICLAIALALSWFFLRRIDLNEFSMNHFYRNRLVRCYLGASRVTAVENARSPHPFTGFDFDDDLPLARLARDPDKSAPLYVGPYPILSAALNSSKGGDLATQERRAESFVFSPLFVGAEFVRSDERDPVQREDGYRRTWTYANSQDIPEKPNKTLGRQTGNQERHGLTLGTCMSISGAAVSPNWGYHTSPVTAFLLTIVNARLGWWLPSPWNPKGGGRAQPGGPCKWLSPLVSELTGTVSTKSPFIYTSDGGHFENLGIYELVRRRCGFIIVVDGEQDGEFHFHGMGTAIRRCRVDFNTEINLDLTVLRSETAENSGYRKGHCAVGRILYPEVDGQPRSVGVIVYLKGSLTGDEPEDIRQYRTQAPEFPHETTLDQFFSESQFESYRRLGQHVAKEALEVPWNLADRRPDGIPDFAQTLLNRHSRA